MIGSNNTSQRRGRRRHGCSIQIAENVGDGSSGGGVRGSAALQILPPIDHQISAGHRRRGRRSTSIAIKSMSLSPLYTTSAATTTNVPNDNSGVGSVASRRRRSSSNAKGNGVEFQIPPSTLLSTVQQSNYTNNNNSRIRRGRRSRASEAIYESQPSNHEDDDNNDSDDENEEEIIEIDDDDDSIDMPALLPRDILDSDKKDEDDTPTTTKKKPAKKKPAKKKVAAYNHHNSPTTTSGASLRRLGLKIAGFDVRRQQKVCERTNNERFSANYGVSAKTLEAVFLDMKKRNPTLTEHDFLLAADTLKLYSTERTMAGRHGCCEQTYREKWKRIVAAIAALRKDKIKFDPSDFPDDQVFLLTVDGVNFRIREPRVKNPGSHWYDHKSHSAGVTYLVAIDVRRSRICWIDGPRPASASESVVFNGGRKKDKDKDPNALANKIPEGKKVLGDSALRSSKKASTRRTGNSHKMKHFRSRAQGRQETLFKRFKTFGILEQRFRHGYELHKMVLDAVAVIVQYDMENGHPLFDV